MPLAVRRLPEDCLRRRTSVFAEARLRGLAQVLFIWLKRHMILGKRFVTEVEGERLAEEPYGGFLT